MQFSCAALCATCILIVTWLLNLMLFSGGHHWCWTTYCKAMFHNFLIQILYLISEKFVGWNLCYCAEETGNGFEHNCVIDVTVLYMDFDLWATIAVIDSFFFFLSKMALIDACVSVYLGWQKFRCQKEELGPVFSANHLLKCPGSSPTLL